MRQRRQLSEIGDGLSAIRESLLGSLQELMERGETVDRLAHRSDELLQHARDLRLAAWKKRLRDTSLLGLVLAFLYWVTVGSQWVYRSTWLLVVHTFRGDG